MSERLSLYDYAVMRYLAGRDEPQVQPGAALWTTIELLRNRGYVQGYEEITLTERGRWMINPPCLP